MPQQTKSDNVVEAIVAFIELLFKLTDIPEASGEIRRRVTFFNKITSRNHTGGITVQVKLPNMPAKLYIYDFPKFGSRGKYVEFNINSENDVRPGNVTDSKQLVKFSEFGFAAWARFGMQNLDFRIRSRVMEASQEVSNSTRRRRRLLDGTTNNEEEKKEKETSWSERAKQISGYMKNLKINSVDPKYPNFDLEVVKVNEEPLSWAFRLLFYLLNFYLLCCVYSPEHKMVSNGENNDLSNWEPVPQRSSFVYFLVSLIVLRLVVTYYFIPIVYFWLPTVLFGLVRFEILKKFRRQRCILHCFGTIGVLFFIIGFILIDFMPFFIVFFNLSLTFDLLTDKIIGRKEGFVTLMGTLMANIYIAFLCYNPGNHAYYYPDWDYAIAFFASSGFLTLLNIILLCNLDCLKRNNECVYQCLSKYEDLELKNPFGGKRKKKKKQDNFGWIHKQKKEKGEEDREKPERMKNQQEIRQVRIDGEAERKGEGIENREDELQNSVNDRQPSRYNRPQINGYTSRLARMSTLRDQPRFQLEPFPAPMQDLNPLSSNKNNIVVS